MNQRLEELRLITLCISTDNREAFSKLVELHSEGVRTFLYNLTGGDACLTDDLAQETFIKAWLGIRKFKGLSGFKTWLYRIAINEFLTYKRANNRIFTSISTAYEVYDGDSSLQIEASHDVSILLSHLSDTERMIAMLFYIEDFSIKQISKATSLPEGTIKSHLHRARKHLQQFYNRL